MEKISQTLRQAREQRNMTLEEAAQKTHIPLSYLMALEGKSPDSRHRTRLLPDPMYLIHHLRQYAAFLNIDANLVVTQFTNELQDIQEKNNKLAALHQSPQMLGPSPQRSRAISLSIILASILVTLALIGQYSDLHTRAPSEDEERTGAPSDSPFETRPQATPLSPLTTPPSASLEPPHTAPSPVQPSSSSQLSSAPSQTSASSAPLPSASTALVEPIAGRPSHLLQARAKEATWIRVLIEGQPPKEVILQPGQSTSWSSDSTFLITVGNAGGVTLTVDGQELPPLGKSGQVLRNIRLPFSSTETQG